MYFICIYFKYMFYNFPYNLIYLKKDKMLSMWTSSNRYFILFTVKILIECRAKALHSMRKCLTL